MQPTLFPPLRRAWTRPAAAFTLIELLAVMAIILVLAGLILGIAAHANYKGSRARAETEVRALGAAIENYKVDNGTYPRNTDTDTLNPQVNFDPAESGNTYKKASAFLYQELAGLHPSSGNQSVAPTKQYFNFQSNQLEIAPNAPGSVTQRTPTSPYMYIADPFGFSYGYSTAYLKAADDASSGSTPGATPMPGQGFNPTFDLWSTSSYSATGGKGTPPNGPNAAPYVIYSGLWVKNW